MIRFKHLTLSVLSVLTLVGATVAFAGVNPAAPGLPRASNPTAGVQNNQFSSMCVDCHTRNPVRADTHFGSHFVSYGVTASAVAGDNTGTHSGGGWGVAGTDTQAGPREGSQYFKISAWTSGGYSKYGRLSDNASVAFSNAAGSGNRTGVADTTIANYNNFELICESCHNIIQNVAGGNNLLETVPTQAEASNAFCVGCHGYMYDDDAKSAGAGATATTGQNASANATKYANAANAHPSGTGVRGVNTIHWINGVVWDMNHHVTTTDQVNATLVGAGQAWRDTTVIDPAAVITSASSGSTIGQMPQLATWLDGKTKTSPNINCVNCHAEGHRGSEFTGASILRDTSALATTANTTGVERLGEVAYTAGPRRKWLDFNDGLYCSDCHTLSGAR